jgi:hypothetical protein
MSRDEEYVPFQALKEDWTVFELPDGTILKAKFVLQTVLKRKGSIGQFSFKSQNIVSLVVPDKYWGEPVAKTYIEDEIAASVEEDWIEGIKSKTPDHWNVYQLENGVTISVKLELLGAGRTSLYDSKGERIYTFNLQPIVKAKIPPELRKRITQSKSPLILV